MIDTGMCFNSTQNHRFDIRFSLFKGGLILEGFSSPATIYPESTNVTSRNHFYSIFQSRSFDLRSKQMPIFMYCLKKDTLQPLTNLPSLFSKKFVSTYIRVRHIFLDFKVSRYVYWRPQFLEYLGTLSLKFQKARTKIEVVLSLPS